MRDFLGAVGKFLGYVAVFAIGVVVGFFLCLIGKI
jgi:hypothetical protein